MFSRLLSSIALLVSIRSGIESGPGFRSTAVRSDDQHVRRTIVEVYAKSASLRGLVDEIEQLRLIVYVEPGFCASAKVEACLVHSVVVAGGQRWLRILVDPRHGVRRLGAIIGHELQHAVEVGRHPEVVDSSGMERLARAISDLPCGRPFAGCFETRAAVEVEKKIFDELRRHR